MNENADSGSMTPQSSDIRYCVAEFDRWGLCWHHVVDDYKEAKEYALRRMNTLKESLGKNWLKDKQIYMWEWDNDEEEKNFNLDDKKIVLSWKPRLWIDEKYDREHLNV